MYLNLIKKCLLDNIYDSYTYENQKASHNQVLEGSYWPLRAHTMIGLKRLTNIQECFEDVIKNKVEGDLIETGVWRGGATIFMKGLVNYYGETNRKVFVADSFEGLPPPDPRYPVDQNDPHHTFNYLRVSQEEVKQNFQRYDLLDENVIFIKGFFEHTLHNNNNINKLSILRLDGDMYSSTIQVLESLYDKLSVGGYCIIDDYGLNGCRHAVDDFIKTRNIQSPLIKIDYTGVYFKKLEN